MNRIGSWIPVEGQWKNVRKAFWVILPRSGECAFVDGKHVESLGFKLGQAPQASKAFVKKLYQVSEVVRGQQPYNLNNDEAAWRKSLKLDDSTSESVLIEMRKLGAGLRRALSEDMRNALRVLGFLREGVQEEPALTFQGGEDELFLWEMMYEGDQIEHLDWEKFWGFRIPITHWVGASRTEEIRLQHGLFSATSENLHFSGREVMLLTQQLKHLKLDLAEGSLTEMFHRCVDRALRDRMHGDKDQVTTWWDIHQHNDKKAETWLNRFLDQSAENVTRREGWKNEALVYIFKDSGFPYDLIHFACHCAPSQESEFLSRLDMTIAGEPVSLDVSFMSDLRRNKKDWNHEDPGPLVFLNACGTGQQSSSQELPGFPEEWIKGQGALAVIATLCPVPDYFAHAFAKKFYETLFEAVVAPKDSVLARNCYLAETLLTTRRYFMQEYNNPLGLAYVLYAANGAYIQADLLLTEDAV